MPRPYSTTRADDLFERASPLSRIAAFAVDVGLAVAAAMPLFLAALWVPDELTGGWPVVVGVLLLLLPGVWTWQSVRLGRRGQTEGMRRAGVWLVDARTGRPAGVFRAGLLRRVLYLPYLAPGVGTLLLLLDALVLARRNGRTLLDRLTGTVVLKDIVPEAASVRLAALARPSAETRVATASMAQRAGALALDLALSLVLLAPLVVLIVTTEGDSRPEPLLTVATVTLLLLPVHWLAQSVRLGRRGQTLGMRRAEVWLVEARTLQPPGIVRALVRRLLWLLLGLVPVFGLIVLLLDVLVFLREDGRALLDRATGTLALPDPPDALP